MNIHLWAKHSDIIENLRDRCQEPGAESITEIIKDAMEDSMMRETILLAMVEVFASRGYRGGAMLNNAIEMALEHHYERTTHG